MIIVQCYKRVNLVKVFYKATKYLKDFVKHGFLDDTIFEDFGMDYLGPIDGHNIGELIRVLNIAKTK